MTRSAALVAYLLFALAAMPALAQSGSSGLALDITDGRITIDARDVPVAQILERWSRLAGITVVNADKLLNARVTIRLEAVAPRQALDVLLRDAGGYIAASRPHPSGSGTEIDRILIVPRSAPTAAAAPQRASSESRVTRVNAPAAPDTAAESVSAVVDSDPAADEQLRNERQQAEQPRADRRPAPPAPSLGASGASQPLVNGLMLDEIRARGVRTSSDPVDPPVDPGRYAARQQEEAQRRQQAERERLAAEQGGPFGAKGTAAQPGTVAPPPPANGPQPAPTSKP